MTTKQCKNCKKETSIATDVAWAEFVCPECCTQHFLQNDSSNFSAKKYSEYNLDLVVGLELGATARLDEDTWEVINITVKKTKTHFLWREFTLCNAEGKCCYLSEAYDGHWMLAKEILNNFESHFEKAYYIDYDKVTYRVFNKDQFNTIHAEGFFQEKIATTETTAIDFVCNDKALLFERNEKNVTVYLGRHIGKKELEKAFANIDVPEKRGYGMVQPFYYDTFSATQILLSFAALCVAFYINILMTHPIHQIITESYALTDATGKETVSPSFQISGVATPLTVELKTNVNNSWAAAEILLVNENTNEERYTSQELEYYYGVEGGESWSEGSQSATFNICAVPAGNYHFVVQTFRQTEANNLSPMLFKVVAHKPMGWNLFWALFMLLGAVAAGYAAEHYFERERWFQSDFSPYTYES